MTDREVREWWKMIERAAAKAPEVVPAPRVYFCWYCSNKLRGKSYTEVSVDGFLKVVHKACAKYIAKGDWEQAEHPERYGLNDRLVL